jgi:hypothetical protein
MLSRRELTRKFPRTSFDVAFIHRQEQTAAELANQAMEVGLCESNSQLNTGERLHRVANYFIMFFFYFGKNLIFHPNAVKLLRQNYGIIFGLTTS